MTVFGMEFEQEEVPKGKQYMISTRENSRYRWQDGPNVIGALEVHSEPDFNPTEHLKSKCAPEREEDFDKTQEVWDEMKLRDEFVEACEGIPKSTCCCGLIPDDDSTIKELARVLTRGLYFVPIIIPFSKCHISSVHVSPNDPKARPLNGAVGETHGGDASSNNEGTKDSIRRFK
jgi:hypothetical protein